MLLIHCSNKCSGLRCPDASDWISVQTIEKKLTGTPIRSNYCPYYFLLCMHKDLYTLYAAQKYNCKRL